MEDPQPHDPAPTLLGVLPIDMQPNVQQRHVLGQPSAPKIPPCNHPNTCQQGMSPIHCTGNERETVKHGDRHGTHKHPKVPKEPEEECVLQDLADRKCKRPGRHVA